MNVLDYVIIILLAIPVMYGVFKGFMRIMFSVLGVVSGFVLSIVFARPLGVSVDQHIGVGDMFLSKLLAFIIIFLSCGMLGMLTGWLARKIMVSANLGLIDRLVGGILGFIQGALVSAALLITGYLLPVMRPWVDGSVIGSAAITTTVKIGENMPPDWAEYFSPARWLGESRSKILGVINPSATEQNETDTKQELSDRNSTGFDK